MYDNKRLTGHSLSVHAGEDDYLDEGDEGEWEEWEEEEEEEEDDGSFPTTTTAKQIAHNQTTVEFSQVSPAIEKPGL